jgi:hypothetical protein
MAFGLRINFDYKQNYFSIFFSFNIKTIMNMQKSALLCAIATAFICGMLWLIITSNKSVLSNFESSLSREQLEIMEKIKKERFKIWAQGLLFGFIIALLAARFLPFEIKGENMHACAIAAIAMGFNYIYYILYPKSNNMLTHLRPEQLQPYQEIKSMMMFKYHVGLLLGFVGSFLLTKGLSNYTNLNQLGGGCQSGG